MKEKAVHNGYCLHCGKEGKKPFCNRQCYLGYVRQNPNRSRDYEKQQRNELTDRIVKRNIYIRSKGGIKYNQMTPKMIEETRARILAHRQKPNKVKTVRIHTMPACCICGKTFQGRPHAKYCSKDCKLERGRRYYREHSDEINRRLREQYVPKEKGVRVCGMCGCSFLTASRTASYCSDQCRSKARIGSKDARKKARNNGVFYEYVNPLKVFKRDGWRCQLCGKKLKPKYRGTIRDDAPELDHIIPWAQGGEHSYRNTQCACRKCNAEKGARELGQLRLFG